MFIGRYQHTIDPKGRVSIPARYRNALAQYDGNLVVVPQDQCLNVYPFAVWERVVGALNEQSQFDERLRRVGRLWISRAREAELDGAGRILRSEEHTSELQSQSNLVCRLLLEKKKRERTSSTSSRLRAR